MDATTPPLSVTARQLEGLEAILAGHAHWYKRDPYAPPIVGGGAPWRTTSSQGGARARMGDALRAAGLITEYEKGYEPAGGKLTAAALRLLIAHYTTKGDRLEHYDGHGVRLPQPYSMLEKAREMLPVREEFERRRDIAKRDDQARAQREDTEKEARDRVALAERLRAVMKRRMEDTALWSDDEILTFYAEMKGAGYARA